MATKGITLTHADVNSGTAVELAGAEFNYGIKKLVRAEPVIGQSTYVPAPADIYGIENPVISIRGNIDVDDTTGNEATETLLKAFWTLNSATAITLNVGLGGVGDSDAVAFTKYDGTTANIPVRVKSLSFVADTSAQRGHMIAYSMELVEDNS